MSLEAHTHGRSVEIGGILVTHDRSYITIVHISQLCVVFKQRQHNPLTPTESILIAIIITTQVDTYHTQFSHFGTQKTVSDDEG